MKSSLFANLKKYGAKKYVQNISDTYKNSNRSISKNPKPKSRKKPHKITKKNGLKKRKFKTNKKSVNPKTTRKPKENIQSPKDKSKKPTIQVAEAITKTMIHDATNYISSTECNDTTSEVNFMESYKTVKKSLGNGVLYNQEKLKKFIEQDMKKLKDGIDFDPDFRNGLYFPNVCTYNMIMNHRYNKKKRAFNVSDFINLKIPVFGVSYINSQLRQPNPQNRGEMYCKNSNIKTESPSEAVNKINPFIKNDCAAYNHFNVTLMSFRLTDEPQESITHRPCVYCILKEYTNISYDTRQISRSIMNINQLFSVLVDQPDGYRSDCILSQGDVPVFFKHMVAFVKTNYVFVEKKKKISTGWLSGLSEIPEMHFQ